MPARTFTTAGVNNLWSNPLNWDGGLTIPANTDTVTIPLGQTCEYDYDNTAHAAGIGNMTITGELAASLTPGTYVLKMAGNIIGTGTLRAGSAGTPYPSTCKFRVLLNGAYKIAMTGDGSLQLYDTETAHKIIKLSGIEAAGQTVLSVDTDVMADIWAAGDLIRIDNINQTNDSEARTIAVGGIAAATITVTAGLTSQKETGSYVILISRNVAIIGNGIGTTDRAIDTPTNGVARCEISGCTWGINGGSGHTVSGTISGCTYGIYWGSEYKLFGAVLQTNTLDLSTVPDLSAYNTLFASAIEYQNYNTNARPQWGYCDSFDHDQVAGAFKAWTRGGIVTSVASPVIAGRVRSYQHACESATYPVFRQRRVLVEPGKWLYVKGWVQKSVAMAYLPRLQIIACSADPLVAAANTPLSEATGTDIQNTWEELAVNYFNNTTRAVDVFVRSLAKNVAGNAFFDWTYREPTFALL